jgi:hypothetical protein
MVGAALVPYSCEEEEEETDMGAFWWYGPGVGDVADQCEPWGGGRGLRPREGPLRTAKPPGW